MPENWETAKRYLLGDMKFLDKLIEFNIKKVPENRFYRLRNYYFKKPGFTDENIQK